MSIPAWPYLSCPPSSPPPFFVVFDQSCWLLYCCWLPLRALLSSLLLSCCTQCYCEALRAQTIWGALEVFFIIIIGPIPRSGELRTQKLKSHLVRTQSLNVLPLKPGVGHYIAIQATLTAGNFLLACFYPSSPFTCIFSRNLSRFFPVLAVAKPIPV